LLITKDSAGVITVVTAHHPGHVVFPKLTIDERRGSSNETEGNAEDTIPL
jgi:hypothetical protein